MPTATERAPPRLVLDTNVSLDLFVFGDPRWRPLREALESGRCEAVIRDDCRDEYVRVLGYPQFGLDAGAQAQALATFDALYRRVPDQALPQGFELPRCADPDDQKFLELAWTADAGVLLTKDKALLKLARRHARCGLFAIQSPLAWVQQAGPQGG